jgi:hypothetical protein
MYHMYHDKALFTNYYHLKYRLYVGKIESGLMAVEVEDIEIRDPNSKSHMLNRVLHMSKLKCRLMSLNTFALVGLDSTITKNGCTMSNGDFRIQSLIRMDYAYGVRKEPQLMEM